MWPPGTSRNWCLGSERLSYFTSLFTPWILAIWGWWNDVDCEIKPPHNKDGKFKYLKASLGSALVIWHCRSDKVTEGKMPVCCFLSPNHMRVLMSIKIATLNPFMYRRKQWKSNPRHEWLSGDAANATKNWTYDQVAGFTCMPLEHILLCHLV